MSALLVETQQDASIRVQDLTKIVMARSRLGLAAERLVPSEARWNILYANDRPCAFHDLRPRSNKLPQIEQPLRATVVDE